MSDRHCIMLVEDSITQAAKLRYVLEQEGWKAICAHTAEEACEKLDIQVPDLILVDYHLPGLSGDELCRRIRMHVDARSLPIIMLTADQAESTQLRGLESGADHFISKSDDYDILLMRIRMLLDKHATHASILGSQDTAFRRARMLTIDDSATFLHFLASELEKEGYQVAQANGGRAGLDLLAQEHFDCVLVDLVMPDINGIEVCRTINQLRQQSEEPIAVLMLTGCENKDDLMAALDAGADDFVGKSSDIAVLKGRIRALLRRKFYQEENQRILRELRNKELEAFRARVEQSAAEARAQLYEELKKVAAELKRSNTDLEQFAYVASHDLKEPLRMVASYTRLLAEECGDRLTPDEHRYIAFANDGARRMQQLINDLLEYARLGRHRDVHPEVDLQAIVEDVRTRLSAAIADSGATLDIGPLPRVPGNPTQLGQLLQNLIGNALKFHGDQPPVVNVAAVQEEDHWTLTVRDNGIGVDPEFHQRIFQIFQRLHTREEYEGTGIGLAVCQRIVEQHGGTIWLESEPGQGSAFHFTLPILAPTEAPEKVLV